MARLALHIGQHKTGTSAIQRALRANVDALEAQGWQYPRFLRAANHVRIPLIFAGFGTVDHVDLESADGRALALAALDTALTERVRPGAKWIISSEEFSGSLDGAAVEACTDFFHRFFDQVHAIYYVRRPDHLLAAIYSEFLKILPYFDLSVALTSERPRMFDQRLTIDAWERSLGLDGVLVRPYLERYRSSRSELIDDFGGVVGVSIPVPPPQPGAHGLANRGLSVETVAFLRAIAPEQEAIIEQGSPPDRRGAGRGSGLERTLARFWVAGEGESRFDRPGFVRAVAIATPGPKYTPSQAALTDVIDRFGSVASDLASRGWPGSWGEWLEQAGPEPSTSLSIAPARVAEVIEALARPTDPEPGPAKPGPLGRLQARARRIRRR